MKYNNTIKYLFSSFFFVEFISMIYNGVLRSAEFELEDELNIDVY